MDTIKLHEYKIDDLLQEVRALCDEMEDADCHRVRDIIEHITNRWSLSVLSLLAQAKEPLRFSKLQRDIGGVTQKVLTQTLRRLESNGLVTRQVFAQVPPRVDYALTPTGLGLLTNVLPVWIWIARQLTSFERKAALSLATPDSLKGRD